MNDQLQKTLELQKLMRDPAAVLALIAENARLAAAHDLLMSNALPRKIIKLRADYEQLKAENERLKSENDEPEWHLMMTRLEDQNVQLKAENEALRKALSDLVSGDVGQSVQWKLSSGQGAETADGKAWLAAAALSKGEQP